MSTGTLPEHPAAASENRELLDVLHVLASLCTGDFSLRAEPLEGLAGQVVERVNQLATLHERRTRELVRAGSVIGREGRTTERRAAQSSGRRLCGRERHRGVARRGRG